MIINTIKLKYWSNSLIYVPIQSLLRNNRYPHPQKRGCWCWHRNSFCPLQ